MGFSNSDAKCNTQWAFLFRKRSVGPEHFVCYIKILLKTVLNNSTKHSKFINSLGPEK